MCRGSARRSSPVLFERRGPYSLPTAIKRPSAIAIGIEVTERNIVMSAASMSRDRYWYTSGQPLTLASSAGSSSGPAIFESSCWASFQIPYFS